MLVSYDILPADSLAFIFQANREFTNEEVSAIEKKISDFVSGWTSHQVPVNGFGKMEHKRFLLFFADESNNEVSGCSKDKVTQFIRDLSDQYQVNFFDRLQIAYLNDANQVSVFPMNDINEYYHSGKIKDDTLIFNNLVSTKDAWERSWKQKLAISPFSRYLIQKAI